MSATDVEMDVADVALSFFTAVFIQTTDCNYLPFLFCCWPLSVIA